jgi:hypothetical protein
LVWVLLGFVLVYSTTFVPETFLNPERAMRDIAYVPNLNPVGIDLRWIMEYSRTWATDPAAVPTGYTPFATIFFTPLALLSEELAYFLITLSTLVAFGFITALLPHWITRQATLSSLTALLLVIGMLSYGFYFELERGQFNAITMALVGGALVLFRTQPRWRWVAYGLFTIAAQLKLFPLVFIVFLVDDWQAWRANIVRFVGLAVVNIALLFVFGQPLLQDFVEVQRYIAERPFYWVANHSIASYLTYTLRLEPLNYFTLLEMALWLGLGLGCSWFWVYRRPHIRNEATLFLVCTTIALVFPALSHDYKLTILGAALGIFYLAFTEENYWQALTPPHRVLHGICFMLMMAAYTVTTLSFWSKPPLLDQNTPLLFVVMALGLGLNAFYQMRSPLRAVGLLIFVWILVRFVLIFALQGMIVETCNREPLPQNDAVHLCYHYKQNIAPE